MATEEQTAEGSTEGTIKQGSIASFMRKRTQLVGFDTGHFKHVQYVVEFLDNSLDAIESFHWKTQDTDVGYKLESEMFQDWVDMEEAFMEANTKVSQGLSQDLSNVFSSMGESPDSTTATIAAEPVSKPAGDLPPNITPIEAPEVQVMSKMEKKTDADKKMHSIIDAMNALTKDYVDLVPTEPLVIIKLSEVEDKSLVFLDENKNSKLYCFEIFDTGSGMHAPDLEKYGIYLASSKSEKLRQTRGSQGFGSPSAFSDAQNTTGKPIQAVSKHWKDEYGNVTEFFTTGENKKSYTIEPTEVDTDFVHGTYVRLYYTNIRYVRGYVDQYIKQTALMNSHVNIVYIDPYGETHFYKRLVGEFPAEPKYAKPHPTSINIGEFQDMLRTSSYASIKQFMVNSFVRISDKLAAGIIGSAEAELQDKLGFLMLSDAEYITLTTKEDDYIYVLREEKRIFGKSQKSRKTWVVYLLNVAKADAVAAYKEVQKQYKEILSKITKYDKELKKLNNEQEAVATKKEKSEILKKIKALEKEKKDEEKNKDLIKKAFSDFIENYSGSLEEITDENVVSVITEKKDIVKIGDADPRSIQEVQVNTLFKFFTNEKYLSPPTDTAIPVGEDVLESVLIQEFGLNISKFDQYFEDSEEKIEFLNDRINLPKMQKEYKESKGEEVDEESKIFKLVNLEESEFVKRMAGGPLIKFSTFVDKISKELYSAVKTPEADGYKKHELFLEEIMEEDLDFVGATTRPPTSGKGLAFVVEAAIAYGNNVKPPTKAQDAVYRFVNRTPKLRDNADCAIWKGITNVNWKNYLVDMFDNGIPKASMRVFVNVSGPFVHLMFKSQSKQALAEDDNLLKEIKLALEQVGRRMRAFLSKKQKHADSKKRADRFIKFAPDVAKSILGILSRDPNLNKDLASEDTLVSKLIEVIGKKPGEIRPGEPAIAVSQISALPAGSERKPVGPKSGALPRPQKAPAQPEQPAPAPEQPAAGAGKPAAKRARAAKGAKLAGAQPAPAPQPAPVAKPEPQLAVAQEAAVDVTAMADEEVLKYMPDEKYVNISYLIKALKIKDITDARFLDLKLKNLVAQSRLEKVSQDGKSYFKKK
jgi:DNA topoisomerase VI B subunit